MIKKADGQWDPLASEKFGKASSSKFSKKRALFRDEKGNYALRTFGPRGVGNHCPQPLRGL